MTDFKFTIATAVSGIFVLFSSNATLAQDLTTNAPPLAPYENLDKPLVQMERGNDWLGTNELKREVEKDSSIKNRFNLATGYLRTGRLDQARHYYESVVAEGSGKTLAAVGVSRVPGVGPTFDVDMAAADRLLYIDWLQNRSARSAGAISAEIAATNASMGAAKDEVTDDQARSLDRQHVAKKN